MRPNLLPELTEETLSALAQDSRSASIILGGGVALKHYDDFRSTQDVDAWWEGARDPAILEFIRAALEGAAAAND